MNAGSVDRETRRRRREADCSRTRLPWGEGFFRVSPRPASRADRSLRGSPFWTNAPIDLVSLERQTVGYRRHATFVRPHPPRADGASDSSALIAPGPSSPSARGGWGRKSFNAPRG